MIGWGPTCLEAFSRKFLGRGLDGLCLSGNGNGHGSAGLQGGASCSECSLKAAPRAELELLDWDSCIWWNLDAYA
jgi:hypothetical protein